MRNFNNNNGEGGGILNIGTLEVSDSTFDGNEDGVNTILGGAALANWGDATITGSTFSRNGHLAEQDTIWTQGTLSMTNSTISDSGRGGIDNEYGNTYLNYVTIAYQPPHWHVGSQRPCVHDELTARLQRGAATAPPTLPLANPSEANIMDTDGTCGGITVSEADLQLAALGDYGGMTETHALGAGSAAIDRVAPFPEVFTHKEPGCIPIDQRGEHRPTGQGCDLGAYEFTGEQITPAAMLAPTGHRRHCHFHSDSYCHSFFHSDSYCYSFFHSNSFHHSFFHDPHSLVSAPNRYLHTCSGGMCRPRYRSMQPVPAV